MSTGEPEVTLEQIYRRHRVEVYRIALRYGGGRRAWAEDVVQDVFVRLAVALAGLDDRDALMGWLYRVTTRRCLHRLEHERVRAVAPLRWIAERWWGSPPQPDAIVAAKAELQQAFALLETLAPKARVAFLMHRMDGRTFEEIGEILGHSKGYICKLVSRAERKLEEGLR